MNSEEMCEKRFILVGWAGGVEGGGFALMVDVLLVSGFMNDLNNNHAYNL
jgi:hypothetical protein